MSVEAGGAWELLLAQQPWPKKTGTKKKAGIKVAKKAGQRVVKKAGGVAGKKGAKVRL